MATMTGLPTRLHCLRPPIVKIKIEIDNETEIDTETNNRRWEDRPR